MGVPGFTSRMRCYGIRKVIGVTGDTEVLALAVIDGPALAHFVFRDWKRLQSAGDSKVAELDYAALGAASVSWLRGLEEFGFEVEGIYFDGALPAYKRQTRIERLQKSLDKLVRYQRAHNKGGKKNGRAHRSRSAPRVIAEVHQELPPPPFLVAAVIEAISKSVFADRYFMVPGEADTYCAAAARRQSCTSPGKQVTIFTDDSDLIIHRSGEHTRVVTLSDMQQRNHEDGRLVLEGLEFWPAELAGRAGLPDLVLPAFEMLDPYITYRQAVANCRSSVESHELKAFALEYHDDTANEKLDVLKSNRLIRDEKIMFETRTSEFVTAAANEARRRRRDQAAATNDSDPEDLEMFLPVLFEDPSRSNAWKIGQASREIAVSLILFYHDLHSSVYEHKKSGTEIRRVKATTLPRAAVDEQLFIWTDYMNGELQKLTHVQNPHHRWIFVLMQMVLSERSAETQTLPAVDDVVAVLNGKEAITWAALHLAAQLQAEWYSVRMIVQTVAFLHRSFGRADETLTRFASLTADYPSTISFFDRPSILDRSEWIDVVEKFLEELRQTVS